MVLSRRVKALMARKGVVSRALPHSFRRLEQQQLTSCIDVANVGVGLSRPPEDELVAVAWPIEAREAPNAPKPRMLDRLLTIEVEDGVRTLRDRVTLDCDEGERVIDGRRSSVVLSGTSIGWRICCDLTEE